MSSVTETATFGSTLRKLLPYGMGECLFTAEFPGLFWDCFALARRYAFPFLKITDIVALYVPIGILFGQLAQLCQASYGGGYNRPWALKFPEGGYLPRHPSQLYEAATEGLLMFAILNLLWRRPYVRNHNGIISAAFLIVYAISRMCMELFREPDQQIGFLPGGITMGQLLSLPFLLLGLFVLHRAVRLPADKY